MINWKVRSKMIADFDAPLVSIVTPAYNAESFIETTIRSVECQTYPNIEHIVIDDGSTDGTSKILKQHEKRYNLNWFSKPNEGQAAAVNEAFDKAQGEIIIWLNADDVLFSKETIATIVETFVGRPEVDVVYGHMAIIDAQNRILKVQYAPPKLNLDILLVAHFAAAISYRRRILPECKLDPVVNLALDYDQCLRMSKKGIKFNYINEILIGWRRHKTAKSISNNCELKKETKWVREQYNSHSGLCYARARTRLLYFALVLLRKLCGVQEVVRLYKDSGESLAFAAEFDSIPRLVIRQAIPFI